MKILVVTNSVPFPPRQGVELPISHFVEKLSLKHIVDLLIISTNFNAEKEHLARKKYVPKTVNRVDIITANLKPFSQRIFREITGIAPTFCIDGFDDAELMAILGKRNYDVAWYSPIGCIGLFKACKDRGLKVSTITAVGLNDCIFSLYLSRIKQSNRGRATRNTMKFLQIMRIPWIWHHQRRLLKDVNLIHVQTELEKKRLIKNLGKLSSTPKIISVMNGKNESLMGVQYDRSTSKNILFMTSLEGDRGQEAFWFINRVWPMVLAIVPDATLTIVGRLPENFHISSFQKSLNIKFCGYIDSLAAAFETADISIIPTRHGTGLINRLVDSLTAGMPIVACTTPLSTIPNLKIGIHALKGDSIDEFANNLIRLLKDLDLRVRFSKNAKILSYDFPSWEETIFKIESELECLTTKHIMTGSLR